MTTRLAGIRPSFYRTLALLFALAGPVLASEPPAEPILRIDAGEHTAMIRRIATDKAGRWLVTAADDKTARVWDLATGTLATTLRPPIGAGHEGKLFSAALSPDGQIVALGGWTQFNDGAVAKAADGHTIYLHDRSSGRLLRRIGDLPEAIFDLAFSPDGRYLAASLGDYGLRLFSVADGRLVAADRDYGSDSYSVHFSADGRLVTTSFDGFLRLYQLAGEDLSLLTKRSATGGKRPYSARFSPDGQRIAVGFFDTTAVDVLDGHQLQLIHSPDTAGANYNLGRTGWSADGAWLYAAGKAEIDGRNFIRRWPVEAGGTGGPVDWPVARDTLVGLAALPNGSLAFGSADPAWGVVDKTGQKVMFHEPPMVDFGENWSGLVLSPEGARVGFGYERQGKSPAVFDGPQRTLLPAGNPDLLAPVLSVPGIEVTDWKNTFSPKLNGAQLGLKQNERSRSLALRPGGNGFVLGTEWYLRAFDPSGRLEWYKPAPGTVRAVNVSQDGRWVVAAYADGTIRWHRVADGAEQLAFYPHPDRKRWIMWTPDGYFDASPGSEDLIGWHMNRGKDQAAEFYPVGWFWDAFYRPDIVRAVLDGQDIGPLIGDLTAEKVLRSPPPREIEVRLPENAAAQHQVTAHYTVTAGNGGIGEVRVFHNGKLIKGDGAYLDGKDKAPIALVNTDAESVKRSFNLAQRNVSVPEDAGQRPVVATVIRRSGSDKGPKPGDQFSDSVAIEPVPGEENEIAVIAYNRDNTMRGLAQTLSFASALPKKPPRLFMLVVGINQFAQTGLQPLVNAVKDAHDFARTYSEQAKTLLASERIVPPVVLADRQASRENILAAVNKIAREAKPQDQFVWFIASHGLMDGNGLFGVIPYDWKCDIEPGGAVGAWKTFLARTIFLMPARRFRLSSRHLFSIPVSQAAWISRWPASTMPA